MRHPNPSVIGGPPLFARLEVIDDERPWDAARNMATDEALLDSLGDVGLLRFYRWREPAVSFGYFEPFGRVAAAYPERDLVRRWTGGGVVEHGQDFTYSLLVPRAYSFTDLRAEECYRLLHGMVAKAIAAAGSDRPSLKEQPTATTAGHTSHVCFANAVRFDLLLAGGKVAGAAQRRTRRGSLLQGSIQLPAGKVAGVYERLRRTLPAALGAETQSRVMRTDEADAAHRLVQTKYGTDEWLRRF